MYAYVSLYITNCAKLFYAEICLILSTFLFSTACKTVCKLIIWHILKLGMKLTKHKLVKADFVS